MTSVGQMLRAERESQGRAAADIATELCITQHYLRALEEDDLKSLPGTFFYKSFVKQYAAILGIHPDRMRAGIEALVAGADPLPLPGADSRHPAGARQTNQDHFLTDQERSHSPIRSLDPIVEDGNRRNFHNKRLGLSVVGLVAVLLACSGFYAWWNQAVQSADARPIQQIQSPVATPVKVADPPAASTVNVTTTTGADGVNHVVLNVSATEATWVSITSDGKEVFSGILQPSQTKTLTGLDAAKMKVGNAGGIDVRWNGKPIGPIGGRGQVRTVVFTPENFQILESAELGGRL